MVLAASSRGIGGLVNRSQFNLGQVRIRMSIEAVGAYLLLVMVVVIPTGRLETEKRTKKQTAPLRPEVDAQGALISKVDPFWQKPIPNHWSMQQVTGLSVEAKTGHIWFLNRGSAAD